MTRVKARCQCLSSCPATPLPGKAFCLAHSKFCPRQAPLSGAEPKYEPSRWNDRREICATHNCFMYAMNIQDPNQIKDCLADPTCDLPFHQPGSISGYPKFNDTDPKSCPNMIARLIADNPTIKPSSFELRCPRGTSKIALIVDEDQDYHFLRQDSDSYFSQKSGSLPVTNLDALGHEIFDVQLANHNWSRRGDPLVYDRFCGYFCVPRNRPLFVKKGGKRSDKRSGKRSIRKANKRLTKKKGQAKLTPVPL
jgi:hypothetical protein